MNKFSELTVVVPAYNRVDELGELLQSIENQDVYPAEVLIVEDCSPQRHQIRNVCNVWKERLSPRGVEVRLVENELNLGFDKNIRKCIEESRTRWALLMGNDDVLLKNAVGEVRDFLSKNDVHVVSRSFVRFKKDIAEPLGVSKLSDVDRVYSAGTAEPKYIFRCSAFIAGLVFDVPFCKALSTDRYDGGLYYQIYLTAEAFCAKGIGYISAPIVGGRADNPPMFGSSSSEQGVHVPGGYSAKSRAAMWRSVLTICSDVGTKFSVDLLTPMKNELMVRQSFHIFEMNAGASPKALGDLKDALSALGLFSHPLPNFLYYLNMFLGRRAKLFYSIVRRAMQ
jgi:abequosyltransferase